MNNTPRLHCQRRHVGCHAACADYDAAKAERDKQKEARRQMMAGREAGDVLAAGRKRCARHLQRRYGGKQ